MTVKIIDPETLQPLGINQPGLLLVRGPNVMQGYLNQPEKTEAVLRDGWYNTGDIAMLDEDGFLRVTDRLSRFSKIGGEMVPHIKVEDKLHELAAATEQMFVVTAVPDERKGERLMVLHTLPEDKLKETAGTACQVRSARVVAAPAGPIYPSRQAALSRHGKTGFAESARTCSGSGETGVIVLKQSKRERIEFPST